MKLSVVVPAFNEERLIAGTLEHLQAGIGVFKRHGWSAELIVCDNNSTDRTADIVRAAGARVVFEPVNQIARARNTGARAASGEWLLFVDADCAPGPALFEELFLVMNSNRWVGGGCTVAMPQASVSVRAWVAAWNALSRGARWAAGAFFFCQAAAFRAAGGFSEELFASEEIDLSRRLKRLGRFVVLHRHPLMTSGRKAELYSWREYAGFMLRCAFSGGRNLRRRDACSIWYDGRR